MYLTTCNFASEPSAAGQTGVPTKLPFWVPSPVATSPKVVPDPSVNL